MAAVCPPSPSLTSTSSDEDTDEILETSILCLSLLLITDILERSSDGGHVRDLILYSVVCKTFFAAVKGTRVLKISRLNIDEIDPDTRQYILARVVHVAPLVEEISFGDKVSSQYQAISPSTLLYWSTVIRRNLKRFLGFKCTFSATHLNALNEMEVLNSVSLTECHFTSSKAAMSKCNPLSIERLSLVNVQFVTPVCIQDILNVLPQLLFLQCVTPTLTRDNRLALLSLSIQSNSLTTLKINSHARFVTIKTPNLEKLWLHTACNGHFDIGEAKNLKSILFSNDISEGLSSREATIRMQCSLQGKLEELSPLGDTNRQLCQNLIWKNAISLESLTVCGDPPTGSGDYPIGTDVHPLPRLQKLCFENIPFEKEVANRIRPWLEVCRNLEEVVIIFKAASLDSTSVFSTVQEILWLQRLYPKLKFSTPWT